MLTWPVAQRTTSYKNVKTLAQTQRGTTTIANRRASVARDNSREGVRDVTMRSVSAHDATASHPSTCPSLLDLKKEGRRAKLKLAEDRKPTVIQAK